MSKRILVVEDRDDNTGTLGRIGFEGRFDYSAIGTVVNLAARLCGEAADGQIHIEGKVKAAVEDVAVIEPSGALALKGFHRPVEAYNVRSVIPASQPQLGLTGA